MKFDNRVTTLKNNYIRMMASMSAQEVDLDRIRSAGEELNAKLEAVIEEETQKGHDSIRVIPDLLNLQILADRNTFSDNIREVLSLSLAVSDNASALAELGFTTPNSYGSFNVASSLVSGICKRATLRLYHNLINAIKNPAADDQVVDIILDAIKDHVAERCNKINFFKSIGMEFETEEELDKAFEHYSLSYDEWLTHNAEDLLEQLVSDPQQSYIVLPTGIDDVKSVLYEICPVEANEYISNLKASDIYGGELFEKLTGEYKLDNESLRKFVGAVDKFIECNSTDQPVQIGNGQSVKPFYSINLGSVLLHAMIMASADLWSNNETLSENTEYIVDLFREELLSIDMIEYSEETAYKLLSTISSVNNLIISRSAFARSSAQDYIRATGAIHLAIMNEIQEEQLSKVKLTDEGVVMNDEQQ